MLDFERGVCYSLHVCLTTPAWVFSVNSNGWDTDREMPEPSFSEVPSLDEPAAEEEHSSDRKRWIIILQLVTIARIPLAVIFALTFLVFWTNRSLVSLLVSGAILGILELSDVFDGYLARKFKTVTEWGKMLDPYADSISRIIVYWALAMAGLVTPLVPLIMAVRDVTVAYCRIVLTRHGLTVAAKLSGKIKAIVQGVGAILIVLQPAYWRWTGQWTIQAFSWLIIVVTLASLVEYVKTAISAAIGDLS